MLRVGAALLLTRRDKAKRQGVEATPPFVHPCPFPTQTSFGGQASGRSWMTTRSRSAKRKRCWRLAVAVEVSFLLWQPFTPAHFVPLPRPPTLFSSCSRLAHGVHSAVRPGKVPRHSRQRWRGGRRFVHGHDRRHGGGYVVI